jgi:hypothetical protein
LGSEPLADPLQIDDACAALIHEISLPHIFPVRAISLEYTPRDASNQAGHRF